MTALVFDADRLADGLRQVLPAAGTDRKRPELRSVLIDASADAVTLAATDTHRLAVRELAVTAGPSEPVSVLVARDDVVELLDRLEGRGSLTLTVEGESTAVVELGDETRTLATIAATFPPFEKILADRPHGARTTLRRVDLRDGLEELPDAPYAVVRASPGSPLEITAGTSTVAIEAVHDRAWETALNPEYLYDVAMAFSDPELVVEVSARDAPVVVTSAGAVTHDTLTYVVMPIKTR